MRRSLALAGFLCLLNSLPAHAQVNYQQLQLIRFDQVSPTARTLSMGGAGIAMVDDSSAAMINPAALRLLVRGEVSIDTNVSEAGVPLVTGGQISRAPRGFPIQSASLEFADTRYRTSTFPTVAFAYPMKRAAIAIYAEPLIGQGDYTMLSEAAQSGTAIPVRSEDYHYTAGLDRGEIGGAVSVSLLRNLSVGFGIGYELISLNDSITGEAVASASGTQLIPVMYNSVLEESAKPAFTFGVSWNPTSRIAVGAVHRRTSSRTVNNTATLMNDRTGDDDILIEQRTNLHTPDSTGVGIGVRVTETFKVLLDARRVRYSQTRDLYAGLIIERPETFVVKDVTEVRAGTEYVLPFRGKAVALRAGLWQDPSHSFVYTGNSGAFGMLYRELFADRIGDRLHKTAGAGFSVSRWEFNVGADVAPKYQSLSGSAVIRFK